jgi:hypothetical protein
MSTEPEKIESPTAEVVSLHGTRIYAKGVPCPDVIEMLEYLLDLARRGEIHGVHAVVTHDDGAARKGLVGRATYCTLGALSALHYQLLNERDF